MACGRRHCWGQCACCLSLGQGGATCEPSNTLPGAAMPPCPLQLPAAEFAYSMGLPTAPKLRFLKKAGA